jgi:hypothetical protein
MSNCGEGVVFDAFTFTALPATTMHANTKIKGKSVFAAQFLYFIMRSSSYWRPTLARPNGAGNRHDFFCFAHTLRMVPAPITTKNEYINSVWLKGLESSSGVSGGFGSTIIVLVVAAIVHVSTV